MTVLQEDSLENAWDLYAKNNQAFHTVVAGEPGNPSGLFDSDVFDQDEEFIFTFTQPGEFRYFCKLHPWTTGTIVVRSS